jgi:CMP/dCMP kinase
MIITISGNAGSGKSTVAKILIKKLNAERIYVGGIRRQLAKDKGISLKELNEYAKTHPETDVDVDEAAAKEAKELEKQGQTVVVEGRVQFHFLPESIKIYVKVNQDIGAIRIWKEMENEKAKEERNEGEFNSFEEFQERIKERANEDSKRYEKYYDIDYKNESNYDFVVDSTNISAQEVANKVLDFINSK